MNLPVHNDGLVYWADGDPQNAIIAADIEDAANTLGCELDAVNQCTPGQMDAYGVAMKDDPFQAWPGLAR